jgi:hypothetical protein
MRFLIYFLFLNLVSCSSPSIKTSDSDFITKPVKKIDTFPKQDNETQTDFRKEFISLYYKPLLIDTFFFENGKKYKVHFNHFCTMDSSLVIPPKYNFDINRDFVTHNFVSVVTLIFGNDTIFKKNITKSSFNNIIDTPLKKYGTLLYPTLSIKRDSIEIHYSISIPVTDIGIGVIIKFDKNGNIVTCRQTY